MAPRDDRTSQNEEESPEERIYRAVRAIPRGRVATYGQLAELAGIPRGHRVAARALKSCPEGLPWHRVLGKHDARRARISVGEPEHAALQEEKLLREGVRFDAARRVSLEDFGWLPLDLPPRARSATAKTRGRRRP